MRLKSLKKQRSPRAVSLDRIVKESFESFARAVFFAQWVTKDESQLLGLLFESVKVMSPQIEAAASNNADVTAELHDAKSLAKMCRLSSKALTRKLQKYVVFVDGKTRLYHPKWSPSLVESMPTSKWHVKPDRPTLRN